ncbi:MAG: NAD(P)/FAD-dependent oxidoreductase [Rhodospirillales bacterium]|nr:NAD(P)/FAD-dependent oxidoreductase [Rhodospirillales bacterium]
MSAAAHVPMSAADLDVIVIGGGPAGLTAALYLGRSRRRTLIVDAGEPRNAAANSAHGVFSRDGATPAELSTDAQRQLERYPTVELWRVKAEAVEKAPPGFVVRTQDGREARSRRLLFATGIRDELPNIDGLAARWANGVLHCVYCHGYEIADQPVALIASPDVAMCAAASVFQLTHNLVLCTNGEAMPEGEASQLSRRGIGLVEAKIIRVSGDAPDLRVLFADGSELSRAALFVRTILKDAGDLPARLGCEPDTPYGLVVGPNWQTSIAGVYAAGDIAAPKDQVIVAAASGAQAAIAINGDLVQADW